MKRIDYEYWIISILLCYCSISYVIGGLIILFIYFHDIIMNLLGSIISSIGFAMLILEIYCIIQNIGIGKCSTCGKKSDDPLTICFSSDNNVLELCKECYKEFKEV